MKGLDNGRGNLSLVIDLETGSPSNTNGGIASRPRGHKTTETDLKHAASARALIVWDFEGLTTEEDDENAKRDVKQEKVATCPCFIDLTKRAPKIQTIEAKEKLVAEENQDMFTNLNLIDAVNHAWFEKKQVISTNTMHGHISLSLTCRVPMKLVSFCTLNWYYCVWTMWFHN
jgi:hypothetical protein